MRLSRSTTDLRNRNTNATSNNTLRWDRDQQLFCLFSSTAKNARAVRRSRALRLTARCSFERRFAIYDVVMYLVRLTPRLAPFVNAVDRRSPVSLTVIAVFPIIAIATMVAISPVAFARTQARGPEPALSAASMKSGQAAPAHNTRIGIASIYGRRFKGRKTASGEIYDGNALTAAHKTLPFGTEVKVTNLKNSRAVTVRINDRGPAPKGRLIDLSPRAADELGIRAQRLARVRIEVIGRTPH